MCTKQKAVNDRVQNGTVEGQNKLTESDQSKYLWSKIVENGRQAKEVNNKLHEVGRMYYSLKTTFWGKVGKNE